MKREKFIIQPGKICTFDAKNILKSDLNSIIIVEVLKMVQYKPFGRSIWRVTGAGDDLHTLTEPIDVPEFLLFPYGMTVVRNPIDFPIINEKDIRLLKEIIYYFDNPPKSKNVTVLSIKDESLNRLKALLNKIELAKSMRDI